MADSIIHWRRPYQMQIVALSRVHPKRDAKSVHVCDEIHDRAHRK